jgi:hypothetical protein
MNQSNENMLKQSAEKEYQNQRAAQGVIGLSEPCRASLIERVRSQADRASAEGRRSERLRELVFLLDKNPDIARILDLVEEVKG